MSAPVNGIADTAGEAEQGSIVITPELKSMLAKRGEIFRILTGDEAIEMSGIEPITVRFSAQYTSNGSQPQPEKYTEQCGLRLNGLKPGDKGRDITIIVGTHHNESAGFDAARALLESWESIRAKFSGSINILYGGEPQTTAKFFHELGGDYPDGASLPEGIARRPGDGAITVTYQKLTDYRNTTENENCNRIPKGDVSDIFEARPDSDTPEKRHLDFQGTAGWLKRKNEAFREYYTESEIVLDLHTLSRMGEPKPLIWFYDAKREWLPDPGAEPSEPDVNADSKYSLLAEMGAESLSVKGTRDAPTDYMASGGYDNNRLVPHMLFETGDHLSQRSGEIATGAVSVLVASHIGAPRVQRKPKHVMRLDGEKLLFTPGSGNANDNTELFTLTGAQGVGDAAKGEWDPYVHIVGTREELPQKLQDAQGAGELRFPVGALQNGGNISAGDVVSYTYWHPSDGSEAVPVFLRSNHGGITYMAPLYTRFDQNDRTHTVEVYTENTDVTVARSPRAGEERAKLLDSLRSAQIGGVAG